MAGLNPLEQDDEPRQQEDIPTQEQQDLLKLLDSKYDRDFDNKFKQNA